MPPLPKKACRHRGCPRTTTEAYCEEHKEHEQKRKNNKRADPFYLRAAWRNLRLQKLANDPLCEKCAAEGRVKLANTVDHKIPRSDRPDLALDYENLRSNCHSCHSKKTAATDGGFGNPKRAAGGD